MSISRLFSLNMSTVETTKIPVSRCLVRPRENFGSTRCPRLTLEHTSTHEK